MLRKLAITLLMGASLMGPSVARDYGQWTDTDPETKSWYEHLMQPDVPNAPCCGEADAYWCDGLKTKTDYYGNKTNWCIVDDPRDNVALHRFPIPSGTEIQIPDNKLTYKDGNPTGHAIVFLSSALYVYCYVQNGGV